MGLSDLVLVAPRARVGATAARMAAHARDVLDRRRVVPDLSMAVGDSTLVVGTTCREGGYRKGLARLEDVAGEIIATSRSGGVALVFGPEDHGLENADLRLCQRLVRIPTSPAYASLNLAQAVLLCGYEVARALDRAVPAGRAQKKARGNRRDVDREMALPATNREREELFAHLASALDRVGFLPAQNPEHILHDVRSLFARSGLTARDVRVWRGIARQIIWAAGARPAALT